MKKAFFFNYSNDYSLKNKKNKSIDSNRLTVVDPDLINKHNLIVESIRTI